MSSSSTSPTPTLSSSSKPAASATNPTNWALHAKHEEWDVNLHELAHKYLFRPSQLVATPICFCMALYASFVYGILYQYVPSTLDTLCHHHTSPRNIHAYTTSQLFCRFSH
jgi:hypothetical protein